MPLRHAITPLLLRDVSLDYFHVATDYDALFADGAAFAAFDYAFDAFIPPLSRHFDGYATSSPLFRFAAMPSLRLRCYAPRLSFRHYFAIAAATPPRTKNSLIPPVYGNKA